MFKKRPRTARRSVPAKNGIKPPSKCDARYWRRRLFKNTFTYKGRRVEVSGWSVKIQLFGKRKTFSLDSSNRAQAAAEACQIYQTILAHGWGGVAGSSARTGLRRNLASESLVLPASVASDVEYWKSRLIHRKYPEQPQAQGDREFSVRIEYAGSSHFFPLGTSQEAKAADRAMRIYQNVLNEGWANTNQTFPRELTLALRWLDNPLAWTYTTIHTRTGNDPAQPAAGRSRQPRELAVAVIEPDDGIRFALAAWADGQAGFHCDATFAGLTEALGEIPSRHPDLVLANHDLRHESGAACLEELQRVTPSLAGVSYSVFQDSDQLFIVAPGGAVGYILKRTPPFQMFEPIAGLAKPVTRERIAAVVRDYFQRLSASLPSGPPSREIARLTPREHEILVLLTKGELAKEIAESLHISVWTVQGHVKSIFEKLNVHTRTEAVVKYLQK